METQTLTFQLRGMTDRQEFHYTESLRLGISEFDGIVRYPRMRRTSDGGWSVGFSWQDERDAHEFRHSELYARLVLSPNVVDFRDEIESPYDRVTEDMIALAA